jgi:hypothetical protein
MAQASTSSSMEGGSQGPPATTSNNPTTNIYMMNVEANIATRARDYRMSESVEKGKEATNPPTPLQIEKMAGETMTHIPKGAFKKASHNPNARASPELLHCGRFGTNPLRDVFFGSPPEFPFTEKIFVIHLGIDRDL